MVTCATTHDEQHDAFVFIESRLSQGTEFSSRFLQQAFSERIENHVLIFRNDCALKLEQIPNFSIPNEHASYMSGCLDDLTSQNVSTWLSNRSSCECLNFQGYHILTHIDGVVSDRREISFVTGDSGAFLPPHVHEYSDALFIITRGNAKFITYTEEQSSYTNPKVSIYGSKPRIVNENTTEGIVTGFRFANGPTLTDVTSHPVGVGDLVLVKRKMPHGFIVPSGSDPLEFISIQSPPIHDEHTHKFDFLPLKEGPLNKIIPQIFNY